MIPGGRVNPRQMRQAMKRMGIEQEELDGVEEVVIRTADKEYVIRNAAVTAITAAATTGPARGPRPASSTPTITPPQPLCPSAHADNKAYCAAAHGRWA